MPEYPKGDASVHARFMLEQLLLRAKELGNQMDYVYGQLAPESAALASARAHNDVVIRALADALITMEIHRND